MARKEKFFKDEIMNKSVDFIRKFGIENLNVRSLANYIGCSTQPIFRNYSNMEEFKIDLKNYLRNHYEKFINNYVNTDDYLLTISYAYALYAKKEFNIFRALFITELAGSRTVDEVINTDRNKPTIEAMTTQYSVPLKKAQEVYRDVRFYTHGIATQLCAKSIKLTDDEIYVLISSMINLYLSEGK